MIQNAKIKLSEVRPCDSCGGKITPVFYLIEAKQCIFDPSAVNSVLGLTQMLGGSLGLAEIMGAQTDQVAKEITTHKFFLCQDCTLMKEVNLGELIQARIDAEKSKERADAGGGAGDNTPLEVDRTRGAANESKLVD